MIKSASFLVVLGALFIFLATSVPAAAPAAGPKDALDKARDKVSELTYLLSRSVPMEHLLEKAKEALELTEAANREVDSAASSQSGGAYDESRSATREAVSLLKEVIYGLEHGPGNQRLAGEASGRALTHLEYAIKSLPNS